MENLNAEQIKEHIELCIDRPNCAECPNLHLCDGNGFEYTLVKALALITSQEQRIKELEAENRQYDYKQRKLVEAHDTYKEYAEKMQLFVEKIKHREEEGYEPSAARYVAEMDMWRVVALEKQKLTEENERLKSEVSVKRKLLDKAEVRIECVEEENNQLKADICNAEMNLGHITEDSEAKDETITNLIETIKSIQADTVRKMQEMVYEFADDLNTIDAYIIKEMIDEIAKEMVEGG